MFLTRSIFFLGLIIVVSTVTAQPIAERISIEQLVQHLHQDGYRILYSSEFVGDEMTAPATASTIEDLQAALVDYNLGIENSGDVFVIKRFDAIVLHARGRLIDENGEPIANGSVRSVLASNSVSTDNEGYFEVQLEPKEQTTLAIDAQGFRSREFSLSALKSSDRELGDITLISAASLENMLITGSHYQVVRMDSPSTQYQLSRENLESVPALAGDALRVVNRLPGTSTSGVSAQPRIRGGLGDEVLILYDGIELVEPFHLSDYQAVLSSIDNRTIDSLDVYTGGFPARYGNRMSGVIDISTRLPESNFQGQAGASNFSQFVSAGGQTELFSQADWSFSFRRGELEDFTQFLDTRADEPQYIDFTAKLHTKITSELDLTLGALSTDEDVKFANEEESASSVHDTDYLWLRLDAQSSRQFRSSFTLSTARIDRAKRGDVFEPDDSKAGFSDFSQQLKQTSFRNTNTYSGENLLVEFGLEATYGSADYRVQTDYFDTDNIALFFGTDEIQRDIDISPSGWSTGVFVGAELPLGNLTLYPALRWDNQNYYFSGSKHQLSPRLGITYAPTDEWDLRFSIGRFHQPEGLNELPVADGKEEFSASQAMDYAALGASWIQGRFSVRSEIYFKDYRNPKVRYENYFNPFVLLPELEPDRVEIDADRALSTGFDLELEYDVSGSLQTTLRYSYMDARDRINESWVSRRWSQRHSLNAQLSWQRDSYSLTAAVAWHSGWNSSYISSPRSAGETISVEEILNNSVLPNYLSLDLSARKSWSLGNYQMSIFADVVNATDRANWAGIDFDLEQTGDQLEFLPDSDRLLPLIYTLGIVVDF